VLNCNPIGNGTPAIIAGVQWVAAHATPPAVVNLSLQLSPGSVSPTLRTAIADLVAKDVVVVAAAGNDNDDVAQVEPANYPGVLAVGGSVMSGSRWVNCGSNFGAAVGLFAPASARTATLGGGYDTPVGTSVSAALVSGAAAATLQAFWAPPKPGVAQLTTPSEEARRILLANATAGAVSDLRGSADRLLYAETWPMSVASFGLPGVNGPTAVAANPFANGETPGLDVSAGLADRFAASPALTGDPFSAQAFDGDTARWSPPPAITQAGCADIDDIGIAHLWIACTRLISQVPQGFVRAASVYDGTTVGESPVGLGLPVAGQTCVQPRSVARAVRVDSDGSVYAGGDASCGTGTRNGFLARLDTPAGYTFWQRRIFDQGTTSSSANALAAGGGIATVAGAADGSARIGQFRASDGLQLASFSPPLAAPSAANAVSQDEASGRVYASAQDANGTGVVYAFGAGLSKQWEQSLSGARINAVAALKDGVLVAGETTRYLPFWPVTNPFGKSLVGMPLSRPRGFLMRYDQSGALRWTRYVNDGAVVGLAAEGRSESGSSILADVVGIKPNPPCPPGPWACLQLPDRGFAESFRIG
jgi:subtilase family protein